jgi:LmbE family N-acetylglucosaminyl deacetylase
MHIHSTLVLISLTFCSAVRAADLTTVRGKTVMVVQAHPDDAESRCAGTVALLKKNGNKIVYVVCSNDDKGTYDPKATLKSHAAVRKKEEEAAVKVLGIDWLEWLGYEDGWVDMVPKDQLRGDIVRMIRKYHPDILFAFDPRNADEHMDHRASAFAAMDAVTAAPFPLYFPAHIHKDRLTPWQVSEVYYYDTMEPNTWVDVSSTIEIKIDALAKHSSQKGTDRQAIAQGMKEKAEREGKEHGMKYAETFRQAEGYVGVTPSRP